MVKPQHSRKVYRPKPITFLKQFKLKSESKSKSKSRKKNSHKNDNFEKPYFIKRTRSKKLTTKPSLKKLEKLSKQQEKKYVSILPEPIFLKKCEDLKSYDFVYRKTQSYIENIFPATEAERLKTAVILDIDDTTILSNPLTNGSAIVLKTFYDLWNAILEKGFSIFFVTARPGTMVNRACTVQELSEFHLTAYKSLYMLPENVVSVPLFKYERRQYIKKLGYHIVLNMGDAIHDILLTSENLPENTEDEKNFQNEVQKLMDLDSKSFFSIPNLEFSAIAIKLPYFD